MRIFIAAAGVAALTATAAVAEPSYVYDKSYAPAGAETEVFYSPSAGTSYEFHDDGYGAPAPGFSGQNTSQALDRTPNMGAGTSRSSNANSG